MRLSGLLLHKLRYCDDSGIHSLLQGVEQLESPRGSFSNRNGNNGVSRDYFELFDTIYGNVFVFRTFHHEKRDLDRERDYMRLVGRY